jgi:NitT/TauT family transport system substrate-binding protein
LHKYRQCFITLKIGKPKYKGRRGEMKKIILAIFYIALVLAILSFTGCIKSSSNTSTSGNTTEAGSVAATAASESSAGAQIELTAETDKSSGSGNTKTTVNVKIASLKGPTSIGMLKLHKENPSLGNNVNSSYEIVPNPEVMVSKILSNEVQIAALPTNVAAKLYNKGSGYRIAAITGYGVLYLLQQNSDIKTWDDLKNKKINVISKGSTPDIALRYLLEKNGLNPLSDVTLDYTLEQVELSQLMIAGKADIAILPEPFVTMITKKNPNVTIAFDIEEQWKKAGNGDPMPMSCVVVSADFADKHREIVEEFLKQYQLSTIWATGNIEAASLLVEEFKIGMDAAVAKEAIPRCNIRFTTLDDSREIIKNYINIILGFSPEDVGGKMPDENFYY